MKKFIAVLMLAVMLTALASCGDETVTPTNKTPAPTVVLYPEWWPQNDYIKLLPAPPSGVELSEAVENENGYSVMMTGATYKAAAEYVEKLKAKGFTVGASPMGYEEMDIYMFSAQNSDGYTVEMIYSLGTLSITVKK